LENSGEHAEKVDGPLGRGKDEEVVVTADISPS
jgi:hypothetical protein